MVCIDDEIPFEIPAGWEWARLGDIVELNPRNKAEDSCVAGYIPMTYINAGYYSGFRFDTRKWSEVKSGMTHLADGDVAFAIITPCFQNRKSIILSGLPNGIAGGTTELNVLRPYGETMIREYLLYFVKTHYFIGEASFKGTAGQQRVKTDYTKNKLIPIPPLDEQIRIVQKITELIPVAEKYEASQNALDELNASINNNLRNSILQEAIQGRLVPQDTNEESASVLLERINVEKHKLLKEGTLKKKDIVDSVIFKGDDNKYYEKVDGKMLDISEEIPFEIPESWAWIRLKELIRIISGTSYQKGDIARSGIRILRGGNIQDNELILCPDDIWLPLSYADQEKNIRVGDVVIVGSTGSPTVIGKPALIKKEYDRTQIGAFLRIIRPIFSWSYEYLGLIFKTEYYREIIRSKAKGTNINNIKAEYIEEMLIPLPPLNEQKRISSQVERIIHTL